MSRSGRKALGSAAPTGGGAAAWQVLWPAVAAMAAAMGIGRFIYTPILPEMLAADALTLREAGWMASANFVGYLLGAMAASSVTDRPLQSLLARAGLLITVPAVAAIGLTESLAAWLAIRLLAGVASAFTLVFASTLVLERLIAVGAAHRMIWLFSGVGLGIVGSSLVAIAAHAGGIGWQGMWLAGALLAAACAVPGWSAFGDGAARSRAADAVPADPDRGAVPAAAAGPSPAAIPAATTATTATTAGPAPSSATIRRLFIAAVVGYGLFGMGYVIHATYLPALVRAAGYSAQAALWIWVLVGLAALPSMLAWGPIVRRLGERRATAVCYAFEGVTALTPLVTDSIVGAAIAAAGLGSCFMAVSGIVLSYARSLDPARTARAIGLMTAAFGLGQIVGPVAAAYLAAGRGFAWPSLLACAVLLSAAAVMVPRFGSNR